MSIPLERITELHYITHVQHLPSILGRGLLSHVRARKYMLVSIADPEVQELREAKAVPQGLRLHQYVNLYLDARNPMMYVRKHRHLEICVLRIHTEVLHLPEVVITDGNAAAGNTAFFPSPAGLQYLDEESVFCQWWREEDYFELMEKRRKRCAEVLGPHTVAPQYIRGAYVSCADAEARVSSLAPTLATTIKPYLFFA